MISLTKITSKEPSRITKAFQLDKNGELVKQPGGAMVQGKAELITLDSAADLPPLIQSLNGNNALCYGVPEYPEAVVVTQEMLAKIKRNGGPPIIARDREHLSWPIGAGVLMKDYDPPKDSDQKPLTVAALKETLCQVVPGLDAAPLVMIHSASGFIYHGESCLKGPGGIRMLTVVKDAADIPRALSDLIKRLWLAGHGYIEISKSGAKLVRSLLDSSVAQPERLDFLAGAACDPPLEQRRPDPLLFNSEAAPLDTRTAIPPLNLQEQEDYERLVKEAKEAAEPEAKKVKSQWIKDRVAAALEKEKPAQEEVETRKKELERTYSAAVESKVLLGDYEIQLASGQVVTVLQLLEDPDRYHNQRCADPLEWDYSNDTRIGILSLHSSGRPYIYSHAHGGCRFTLEAAKQKIQMVAGGRVNTVLKCLEVMKKLQTHFNRGGELVTVDMSKKEVLPRDKNGILFDLDSTFSWSKYDARAKKKIPSDCAISIAMGVLAAKAQWKLPTLTGIATAPTMDPVTGRVIETDGFDRQSGVMLILEDPTRWPGIPAKPKILEVEKACQTLWHPFKDFPFDGPISRGVMLAALLTASVRPLLPTAPGFGYTAPVAGSGKTLIAKCLSELSGDTPAMLPDAGEQDEARKRILALLRENRRVIVWDNVTGFLDSSALCAMLTAEEFTDRVLGVSQTVTVSTRTLFLITGNNIQLRGDLCRRVLTARIDPESETPWKRCFDLDPAEYCRTHRLELVAAALTILRAGKIHGNPLPDRTASFEIWSDSVRRAVCFIRDKAPVIDVADPVESIDTAYSLDPETGKLAALMTAWWDLFQDAPVTVADVKRKSEETGGINNSLINQDLNAAADEIAGDVRGINPRRLGRWLEKNRDRIIDGMRFSIAGEKWRAKEWRLRKM